MNGKITKALILLALSLTATTGYSARRRTPPPPSSQHPAGYDQRHGSEPHQMMGGHNAPARNDVNNAWDFFVSADFIYWQPRQDNMALATGHPDSTFAGADVSVIYQKFGWKPGFKVGVGMNFEHDNWVGLVEYTWFHNTHNTSSSAPNFVNGGTLTQMWMQDDYYTNLSIRGVSAGFNSRWNLDMDLLDFVLQRTYYVGTKLSCNTFFGGRATWINQGLNIDVILDILFPSPIAGLTTFRTNYQSNSCAIGPRFGMDLSWMLGWGFSLASKLAGDISYTRYRLNFNSDQIIDIDDPSASSSWKVSQLRSHGEAGFGLAWGSYFWDNGLHIQFVATYDFNCWWNQNMMRARHGNIHFGEEQHGDLYTHGLDLKVKLDF